MNRLTAYPLGIVYSIVIRRRIAPMGKVAVVGHDDVRQWSTSSFWAFAIVILQFIV